MAQEIDKKEIESIFEKYEKNRRFALAIMQDMQNRFQYIPREGMEMLAEYLDCPMVELYAMATFYKALSLKPKGKHIIKCCDGTACHIRGSLNLVGELTRQLGVGPGETTPDGLFSFETVNCMGSCALAPVVVVDEKYYGKVTMEQIPKILDEYRKGESGMASTKKKEKKSGNPNGLLLAILILAILAIIFFALKNFIFNKGVSTELSNAQVETTVEEIKETIAETLQEKNGADNQGTEGEVVETSADGNDENAQNPEMITETQKPITTQKPATSIKNTDITDNSKQLSTSIKSSKVLIDHPVDYTFEMLETVKFGKYLQDGSSVPTDIEWFILEKDEANHKALLFSKYIIDCKRYNEKFENVTWETCTLRDWLNNAFYPAAFSVADQKVILETSIENPNNKDFGTKGGKKTLDKVFCLSIDECKKYFWSIVDTNYYANPFLATTATKYAKSIDEGEGVLKLWVSNYDVWYKGNSNFWLRSPGFYQNAAANVDDDGSIDQNGAHVNSGENGVRPAIWVKY